MRFKVFESRLFSLLPVAVLCVVAVLSGILFSARGVDETDLPTRTEAVAVNEGDKLVAYTRIVNREGEDMNYTYHVLLNYSSGRREEYSRTVHLKDGSSYVFTVNLYPRKEKRANVNIMIYKGEEAEPFEEINFHFP